MVQLTPIQSTRGVRLPDEIEADFLFMLEGGNTLFVQDVKGACYIQKKGRWYRMVEWRPKSLTAAQDLPTPPAPADQPPA